MDNKQLILSKRPTGFPDKDTWEFRNNEIEINKGKDLIVKNHYISLDPAMRGWINEGKSYIEPVKLGAVMRAGTIGEVVKSGSEAKFKVGDIITGMGGVQQYTLTNGEGWQKVDVGHIPMEKYLSVLGMTGMTAYFGITQVGKIKEDDIVLVSAATGAVGSIVAQIAKFMGKRVIGIAGGKDKCDYLTQQLGLDAAVDYKAPDFQSQLRNACPEGIDIYFDNVGGEILDAALTILRLNARVVICGAISQYNNKTKVNGPSNYLSLLVNRATMQGMIVFDYANRYEAAARDMSIWLQEGKITSEEEIHEGLENFYDAFKRLFSGDKRGKLLLKIG